MGLSRPLCEDSALLIGDFRFVRRWHRASDNSALLDARRSRDDLLRRVEHHSDWSAAISEIARMGGMTRSTSAIDHVSCVSERHRAQTSVLRIAE